MVALGDASKTCLAILGSTGSIGTQTLDVVRHFPEQLQISGLAAGQNVPVLVEQIAEFQPSIVAVDGPATADRLREALSERGLPVPELTHGADGLCQVATQPEVGLALVATSGRIGLAPTLAAAKAGKDVALANKEVLVVGGELVNSALRAHGGRMLPVDSEHSAVWQCLVGEDLEREVRRVILTASGGPFRDTSVAQLESVTPAQALRHPNWQMGPKITIDSATLFNKGLEVIEAHWLFALPYDRLEIVIHRESIVHSLVEFVDGSVKAQLGPADMRLPIQYALTHPRRWDNRQAFATLDLLKVGRLTFEAPDFVRFPCPRLAIAAGRGGGVLPATLSAADEIAVDLFLNHRIGFCDIPRLIERALAAAPRVARPTLDDILAADAEARVRVSEWAGAVAPIAIPSER